MTLAAWYSIPELREELARLMKETVLGTAIQVLESRAKATLPSLQTDVTTLALTHAQLAGYQKAIDDLMALSRLPQQNKRDIATDQWDYAVKKATL